jgi:glycosyltransferase involved in cell wall biosynthesis
LGNGLIIGSIKKDKKLVKNKILGIDASTLGSGGAKRHLLEILKNFNPNYYNISSIKIWGNEKLLNSIPHYNWLQKESPLYLNKNYLYRLFWQIFLKEKTFKNSNIDILFSPFGTYTGNFKPYVSMSRNMLIFDKNERNRFHFFSLMRFKLHLLYYIQKKCFKNSNGIIFISNYAQKTISNLIDIKNVRQVIINHGVSNVFQLPPRLNKQEKEKPHKFLYISSIWPYKHHLNVVKAVCNLHKLGYSVELDIVGSPDHYRSSVKLINELNKEHNRDFIFWYKNVGLEAVESFYKNADSFIFASTCENMPNILIEAMASGLPISCSNFYPMPEFIEDAAVYFDPTDTSSIEKALLLILNNKQLRNEISKKSYNLSQNFTWKKCTDHTFNFINTIINNHE